MKRIQAKGSIDIPVETETGAGLRKERYIEMEVY